MERIEIERKKRIEEHLRQKEKEAVMEAKKIKKQEKQARRLELVEAEILQRLKATH